MSSIGDIPAIAVTHRTDEIALHRHLLLAAIFLSPFLSTPPMVLPLFNVGSFTLGHLVPAIVVLGFMLGPRVLPGANSLERRACLAFLIYAVFVSIAYYRSLPYLPIFHEMWPRTYPRGEAQYLVGQLILPMAMAGTFLCVLLQARTSEEITSVLKTIAASVGAVSLVVLGAVVYRPDALFSSDPERAAMVALMDDVFGVHYNEVANVIAIASPILLYFALRRGRGWMWLYWIAFAGVIATKSRTGMAIYCLGSAATMIMLGRAKTLVAAVPILSVAVLAVLGGAVVKLLSLGFTARSGMSTFYLLSGREQRVWLPLLVEWIGNRQKLLVGTGAHGIVSSIFINSGAFGLVTGQAHNIYLEIFVDNGIFVFVIALALIVAFLIWGCRVGRKIDTPLYWCLYFSVVCYLVSGLSGRLYYPVMANFQLFPILAALINVARIRLRDADTPRQKGMDTQLSIASA